MMNEYLADPAPFCEQIKTSVDRWVDFDDECKDCKKQGTVMDKSKYLTAPEEPTPVVAAPKPDAAPKHRVKKEKKVVAAEPAVKPEPVAAVEPVAVEKSVKRKTRSKKEGSASEDKPKRSSSKKRSEKVNGINVEKTEKKLKSKVAAADKKIH